MILRLIVLALCLGPVIAACGLGDSAESEEAATATPTEVESLEATSTPVESDATDMPVPDEDAGGAVTQIALDGMAHIGVVGEIEGASYLFALTGPDGNGPSNTAMLHTFEVADDGTAEEVGSLGAPVTIMSNSLVPTSRGALVEDTLYLPLPAEDGSGGLWVVDVSDPTAPSEIALVETELPPLSVAVSGDLAAVATMSFTGPFLFYDVSDPSNVQLVSEYELSVFSMPPAIAFVDSTLYVADESGVSIIDVTDPETPQEVATYENPDWSGPATADPSAVGQGGVISWSSDIFADLSFRDIAVANQRLYIVAGDGGVQIVDISDPANLGEIGHIDLDGHAMLVATSDDWVYVLEGSRAGNDGPLHFAVRVIDAADASNPQIVDTIDTPSPSPSRSLLIGDDLLVMLDFTAVHVVPVIS